MLSFVDGNNLLQQCDAEAKIKDIIDDGTQAIHTWKTILQITGGDLFAEKILLWP